MPIPSSPAGRLRLVKRCGQRSIAHVAAEGGVSRQCVSKWKPRYELLLGQPGLLNRSSGPHLSPDELHEQVATWIEALRQDRKWSARLIAVELAVEGITVSACRSVAGAAGTEPKVRLDPGGASNRVPWKITARHAAHDPRRYEEGRPDR